MDLLLSLINCIDETIFEKYILWPVSEKLIIRINYDIIILFFTGGGLRRGWMGCTPRASCPEEPPNGCKFPSSNR